MKNSQSTIKKSNFLKAKSCNLKAVHKGFTMIELLVVVGIFALLSSTLFINYSQFSLSASLDNLAHQIALIVRQAQVYGISVSQSSNQQFKGYGAYFSTETTSDQSLFILFNDRSPQDNKYSSSSSSICDGTDECVEKNIIKTGDIVEKIIANGKTAAPGIELSETDIVFTRPNPDANIAGTLKSDGVTPVTNISDVEIYLLSPRGMEKKVVVWSTGQIAVE